MDEILIQRWIDALLVVFKGIQKGKKKMGAYF